LRGRVIICMEDVLSIPVREKNYEGERAKNTHC